MYGNPNEDEMLPQPRVDLVMEIADFKVGFIIVINYLLYNNKE